MTMTREQAIKIITGLVGTLEFTPTQEKAFSMAIEALDKLIYLEKQIGGDGE